MKIDFSGGRTFLLLLLILSLPIGCFPSKKLTVVATASLLEEVARASYKQSDLRVVREGMPAYLMLLDGMIEAFPGNEQLLLAGAQGYTSFASGFVEEENKEYARELYGKGRKYALESLEKRGVKDPAVRPLDEFEEDLKSLGKKDVPYLFWTATCWASWIKLNLASIEALAELPRVELMIKRVLEIDEGFYYGGAHLFMGVWYASRPKMLGGDPRKAQAHFLMAIKLGEGKFLMAYVYYADYYARQTLEKELFQTALQKVLDTPADIKPDLTLLNTIAKKKAKELLDHTEEYFD
jgi:hypothetical protein